MRSVVELEHVTVARAGRPILSDISLTIPAGARIFIGGENGAGKSSLLMLLAAKLHPYNNAGRRSYAWDTETGAGFRAARKHIALVSREEQNRLQQIHAQSTISEFLEGNLDGQDFLYREKLPGEGKLVAEALGLLALAPLADRRLRTLSLGEMRRACLARAALYPRKLYLLDEVFSSLSPEIAGRVSAWIFALPDDAAVVMTGHDADRMAALSYTDRYIVQGGAVTRLEGEFSLREARSVQSAKTPPAADARERSIFIQCHEADFYHDFQPIFRQLSFTVQAGERILLTGPNGSGKTTLLRIMHGDFYPAWGTGPLGFSGPLAHEHKRELWAKVQFIAAAHFTYYPQRMAVREVLASRYSGSIYDYPAGLPASAAPVLAAFAVADFLDRPFHNLSEGEKTRVLFARAFLEPAPVYLIDEGFIALSDLYFTAALDYLGHLPAESAVVIAANERIDMLKQRLRLTAWHIADGKLTRGEAG